MKGMNFLCPAVVPVFNMVKLNREPSWMYSQLSPRPTPLEPEQSVHLREVFIL